MLGAPRDRSIRRKNMKERKFFICKNCGNVITVLKDSGVKMMCCGEKMTELKAGVEDAAHEKHVPVFEVEGSKVTVKVGSVEHPMQPEHSIQWIWVETKLGGQLAELAPGQKPEATFELAEGDELIAVYEYCNLHGLWKAEA